MGEAIKAIGPARTKAAVALIQKLGGTVEGMYALLGAYDLMLIVKLPGIREAMRASVAPGKATGIAFTTAPALSVEDDGEDKDEYFFNPPPVFRSGGWPPSPARTGKPAPRPLCAT